MMLKLHFGCGARLLREGWLNIDARQDIDPPDDVEFLSFDVTTGPLPFADESVSLIYHEDFLEHLTQREVVAFLAETWRVLKWGGVHRINTPDLLASMRRHSRFREGRAGVYFTEWDAWGHQCVLTRANLCEFALLIGYDQVIEGSKGRGVCVSMPPDSRPHSDREDHENLFFDLVK